MNMVFLYPSFLFALSALAIPIAIHFFNFRRYKKIYFSNVSILEQVSQESRSRDRLREWLVLLCRILTLLFLILAFCQPLIPSKNQRVRSGREQVVSIYVDNSNSMNNKGPEGSLLEEARNKAREIALAYGQNTRFQLLTNDFEGRHQRLLYRDEFLGLLDEIRISSLSRSLKEVLSRQNDVLSAFPGAAKEHFLISDFQKNMLGSPLSLQDTSESIHLVPLKAAAENVYIDSVWNASPVQRPGEKEQVIVRICRSSDHDSTEDLRIPVKVFLNGELKAVSTLHLGSRRKMNDTITYILGYAGKQNLEARIEDASVFFDDHFYAAWNVDSSASILLVKGEGANPFIKAVFDGDPFFKLEENEEDHIDYAALGASRLVILDRLKTPPSGLVIELKKFMSKGGNVLFLPRLEKDRTTQRNFLSSFNLDVPDSLIHQKQSAKRIDLNLDLFRGVFASFPKHPDLPYLQQFYRFSHRSQTNAEVLLGLEGSDFMLSRYSFGPGHWYLSAAPFSDSSGNFQRHALFVPIMYKMALLSGHAYPLFYTIGKDEVLSVPPLKETERADLRIAGNHTELIPELRQRGDQSTLFVSSSLKNDGFYELESGGKGIASYAFNYDRSESDMHFYNTQQLELLTGLKNSQILDPGKRTMAELIRENQLGTQLWKVCLILALVFLGLEGLILRFRQSKKIALHVKPAVL